MASVLRILRRRALQSSCAARVVTRSNSTTPPSRPRVAVLYQELDPPLINGVRKPKKPGGYKDSGADIAYVLRNKCEIDISTPSPSTDPSKDDDWCFGDTEQSILQAVNTGATHIWANTILFAAHPLQMSAKLTSVARDINVVGQPPTLVELFDDKCLVNNMLRARNGFTLPGAQDVRDQETLQEVVNTTSRYPVVAKPIRGRGSYGVKVCRTPEELDEHCESLLGQQASVIVEDYLAGQEATITVMPPSPTAGQDDYWAMPVVERFNHADGIAPYNGIVAVTQNSRCVSTKEHEADTNYGEIQHQCVEVARLLQCKAPIRVDVRRFEDDRSSPFALFDVNMKPLIAYHNMTGPGRPGRESQASLTALAARGIGWNYSTLLVKILESSSSLYDLRNVTVPKERNV